MSASRRQLYKNLKKSDRQIYFDLNKIYVVFDWFVNFPTLFTQKEIGAGNVK